MGNENLAAIIIAALAELLELPVLGAATRRWAIAQCIPQASGDPSVAVTIMVWPKARKEVRHQARDHFLEAASLLTKAFKVEGALQFDLFLPAGERAEMRIAWLPTTESLDSHCVSRRTEQGNCRASAVVVLRRSCREELRFDLAGFRLRCIVRCHSAALAKHEMLASVRGTVLADLLGPGSEEADLNVLYSAFFGSDTAKSRFRHDLYINSLTRLDCPTAEHLPAILKAPFVIAEMLSEEELAQIPGDRTVYDEVD